MGGRGPVSSFQVGLDHMHQAVRVVLFMIVIFGH
jgi:hypothetical protein